MPLSLHPSSAQACRLCALWTCGLALQTEGQRVLVRPEVAASSRLLPARACLHLTRLTRQWSLRYSYHSSCTHSVRELAQR